MFNTNVYFENINLTEIPGVNVYNHNFLDLPEREISSEKLARADKSILTSAEYSSKQVTIELHICSDSKEDTEDAYIQLLGYLQNTNGTLRVVTGSNNVGFNYSTLSSVSHEYYYKTLKVTLVFLCTEPFGVNLDTTTGLSVTNTLAVQTYPITLQGSYRIEPYITLTFTSITGGTGGTIKIANENTQKGLQITRDWVSGDVLFIDSYEKNVTVNNNVVDFSGTFPTFLPGAKTVGYIDDFSGRSVDIVLTYNKRI